MAVTDSFVSFGAEMTMPCPRCGAAASSSVSEMIHMDQLRWGYELHCSHCQTRRHRHTREGARRARGDRLRRGADWPRGARSPMDLPRDRALPRHRPDARCAQRFEVRTILLAHLDNLYDFYGEQQGLRIARKHLAGMPRTVPRTKPSATSSCALKACPNNAASLPNTSTVSATSTPPSPPDRLAHDMDHHGACRPLCFRACDHRSGNASC